jgi:hypothetical protein
MPRYRLLAAHQLQKLIGDRVEGVMIEKGTVVDSGDFIGFAASPNMEPLDPDAYAEVLATCEAARRAALNTNDETPPFGPGSVVGYGPLHRAPGGDWENQPLDEL